MERVIRCMILSLVVLVMAVGNPAFADEEKPKDGKASPKAKQAAKKKEDKEDKPSEKAKQAKAKKKGKKDKKSKASQKAKRPAAKEEGKKTKASAKPKPPATHTVKKGPLKIEIELAGVFEAQTMHEVLLRPEQWSTLPVLDAVEHGQRVKRGDLLVTLDMEKIDRAIADLRAGRKTAELAYKLAEEELQLLGAITPLDLAAGRRSQRHTADDLKYYLKVEGPMAKKTADFWLKLVKQYLEYQEEELRQLEAMYKADDLTEETEEIVLKRARNAVEEARFFVETYKVRHKRTVNVLLPRNEADLKEAARRSQLQWDKAKVALPVALKKARLEFEKMKINRQRAEKKLNELLADRAMMVVKAPADGVVYYGKPTRGKFSSSSSMAASLRRGGSISPNQVFMTIVETRPMSVRTTVAEKQLRYVRSGSKAVVKPTRSPDTRLEAIVDRVGTIPISSESYDAKITVELDRRAKALVPGMTCNVKLVPYRKKNALTVPPKVVHTDEWDDQKHYVYLLSKSGKSKKRFVKIGKRTSKKVEILKGLAEGDKVLLERPKDNDKDKK